MLTVPDTLVADTADVAAKQVAAAFDEKFAQVADEIRILGVYRE